MKRLLSKKLFTAYHRSYKNRGVQYNLHTLQIYPMQQSIQSLDKQLRAKYLQLSRKIGYGTAGFRDKAENIEYVEDYLIEISFRVGVFVSILNQTAPAKCLGIVVSASHNKIQDNGLKITNFHGNMLEMQYESILEKFVETESLEQAISNFKLYLKSKKHTLYTAPYSLCIGGDTRPSTSRLLDLIAKGIESQKGSVLNFGLTTTPQLQYYVYHINNFVNVVKQGLNIQEIRQLYWEHFTDYYLTASKYLNIGQSKKRLLDCANGVGGAIFPKFQEILKDQFEFELINNKDNDKLNQECGADHVKTTKKFPLNFSSRQHNSYISFDGDADRILLYTQKNNKLNLIDGDRIGTVLTMFFSKLLTSLKEKTKEINQHPHNCMYIALPLNTIDIGFVQTYYANSASARFLQSNFNMKSIIAATGVKHLHEKAEKHAIGIYFQGNGHGTVIFKREILQKVDVLLSNRQTLTEIPSVKSNQDFYRKLNQYFDFLEFFNSSCRLANPSVGDAITDLLLIELVLEYLKMSYSDVLTLYTDYENRTTKIKVKDKSILKVTDIQDKVVYPQNLQSNIDKVLQRNKGIKAFVRASGTQDVLRLHVEADTLEVIAEIQRQINILVSEDKELN